MERQFIRECEDGDLVKVDQLLQDSNLNVHFEQEGAFSRACSNGHLLVVNRLLELKGKRYINVHAEQENAFRIACIYGHIDVVNRLLELEGKRFIKLSEPSVLPYISEEIKILIIKVLLKKMKRLKLLDELLKQKVDVIEKKELVMGELRAIPGGQDYIQAESSFVKEQLN